MPGLTVPSRRKRTVDSDEEDDSDAASPASDYSNGSKRARYNHDASTESQGPVLPTSYRAPENSEHEEDEDTKDTHQPGSIVRVQLTNFVTYSAVEFLPGPSLNMIIGPNGTGKSTLVCAICLGLGWSPNNLGRAKEIGEFVKHGNREAAVEIELAGGEQTNGRNPVIKRIIKKEGNKSLFFINGEQKNQKQVVALARSFSIQIDNLCQFLPQDRVVEFAQLSPVQLLRETQRAAAPEQMIQWHDRLKDFRRDQKRLQDDQAREQAHVARLQTKQAANRPDVLRMQERQQLEVKKSALEKSMPFVRYRAGKIEYDAKRQAKNIMDDELTRLKQEREPSLRAVRAKETYHDQIEQVVKFRKGHVVRAEKEVQKVSTSLEKASEKIGDLEKQEDAERDQDKRRRGDMNRVKQAIATLKKAMEQAPVDFNPAEYNARIREYKLKIRGLETRHQTIREDMNQLRGENGELRKSRQEKTSEREKLTSESGKLERKLEALSKDTTKAWKWVQENRGRFKSEIFGPALLTCSVKDPRYTNALEARLQKNDFLAITCADESDLQMLQKELLGKDGLYLHDVQLRGANRPLSHWRSPMPREQITSLALDGYLLDYIQGPEAVLSMLCDSAKLHNVGVSLKKLSQAQEEALHASSLHSWVAERENTQVTSRYGQKSISVRHVNNARNWTDQPVDTGVQAQLEREIAEIEHKQKALSERAQTFKEEMTTNSADREKLNAEMKDVESDKNMKQKAVNEFKLLPVKLQNEEAKMEGFEAEHNALKDKLLEIRAEREKTALEIAQVTIHYVHSVNILRNVTESLLEAEIRSVEASSEVDALKEASSQIEEELDQKKRDVARFDQEYQKIRAECKELHKIAVRVERSVTDEEQEIFDHYRESMDLDSVQTLLDETSTRVDLIAGTNGNVIQEYERREEEIARVQAKLAESERNLSNLEEEITGIRSQWEPELDALVAKISDGFARNFEKIGCAGQVNVYKDEDFDAWSIQIQVRFREHEQLSILDSHRQSGGERAVSTIFYLMALQDLARSPFRVVDEINQGMDPRNERMVHERMVDIACRERTSQYFLITPKLLNDLKFHPKMKIHCIASGEWMPNDASEGGLLDFKAMASLAMRVKGKA